ncbi:MAG: hypothetical protein J4431_02485, partial [Candidatus Aenigmarchaeota archaeon]|nr:hypothetical protein [Candidatus Aenigmarchaeota archaeon]
MREEALQDAEHYEGAIFIIMPDEGASRQYSISVVQELFLPIQFRLIPPEITAIRIRLSHARHCRKTSR